MARELRRRGRPLGDGIDDNDVLTATARKIVAALATGKELLPTTAMKMAGCKKDPTTLRRLQRKWQMRSSTYLNAAQAERIPKSPPRSAHAGAPVIPIRTRAGSALDQAYADLGMHGFGTMHRRSETRIERDLRTASKKINDLVMGRASGDQMMRDAGCPNIANAIRDATLGIDRTIQAAMGLGTGSGVWREACEGFSSVAIRRNLGGHSLATLRHALGIA